MIDPYETIEATPEQQAAYAEQSAETLQETIARLAKLHPLEYDKVRQTEEVLAELKREERRMKVLAMLSDKPETQRAFITDNGVNVPVERS